MKYKKNALILFLLFFIFLSTAQAQAPGNALEFDGTDDNITLSSFPTLGNNFTISSWIKPDVLVAGQQIFSIGHSTELYQSMQFRLDGEQLEFGANTGTPAMELVTGDIPLIEDRWNHVAVVFDNTDVTIYVNGFVAGTGTVDMSGLLLDVCHIAAKIDKMGSSMFFDGQIDEICVWNTSFTQTELRAEMYEELVGNETDLSAYFNFNAETGLALEDNTTAGTYDGVLTNMDGDEWTESYALVAPNPQAATNVATNSFTATWNAPITGEADGYYLDVSLLSDFSTFVLENQNVTSGTSYDVSGLNIGTTYYYRVRAYKSDLGDIGAWHYSNPISVFTQETPEPTVQATNIVVSNITSSEMTLDWTRGDGENCAVFALQGNTGEAQPIDRTSYNADAEFQAGDQIASTGWYCIYSGTGSNVIVTSLSSETEYRYMVIEFNNGVTEENYLINTATGNPVNATTLSGINAPDTQADNIEVTNIGENNATISWTNGNGENRAVFLFQGNTGEANPDDNQNYVANTVFGTGDEINASSWFCIYNGSSSEVTVTGLERVTEYRVMVIEYNGTSSNEKYLKTSITNNPVNFTTINVVNPDEVEITNFVSPNGDGQNDFLTISGLGLLTNYQFYILNNIGEILYQTDNYDNTWNATFNGNELPNGTYYYIISDESIVLKGTITVVR